MDIHERLAALGAAVPEILLPRQGIDLEKWAVIACDQFTQDRSYWKQAAEKTGEAPSTLNIIFPEVYLEDGGRRERIDAIHRSMESYMDGVFAPPRRGCMYIERSCERFARRRGLMMALDLEQYDWHPEARPLIRATEGTVPERIIPRMEIRRGAPLECPHVLVLIDDDEDFLLPGLAARAQKAAAAYHSSLMMDSGTVSGWLLDNEKDWAFLTEGLEKLAARARARYGTDDPSPFLFAVGDGNHSLATAKAVWDEYKACHPEAAARRDHPNRWALVEIENIYDPGIAFEPIHRVVFGAGPDEIIALLRELPDFSCRPVGDAEELTRLTAEEGAVKNRLGIVSGPELFLAETSAPGLITDSLQPLLDRFVEQSADRSLDYLHGGEEVFRVAGRRAVAGAAAVGIVLPPVKKSGLFQTVARRGPLPRKSFSMGEAWEKRFYLECRKLAK
ncbi:hypothetical protein AGMMS49928_18130 [Spirochaetia bacterium]|nr:hypothetical protein AGMMS49928_18130 [Spirochaetia bacterium]